MLFLAIAVPLLSFFVLVTPSTLSNSRSSPLRPRQRYPDYLLKTVVVDGDNDAGSDKDGLFVKPYLTGPGLSDAVLGDEQLAPRFWLNGTYEESDFVANNTFGLTMIYTPVASWSQVQVDSGFGSSSFHFDVSGLQWGTPNSFGGWLACDWFHNVPQLFWMTGGVDVNDTIPASCSVVNLVAEH